MPVHGYIKQEHGRKKRNNYFKTGECRAKAGVILMSFFFAGGGGVGGI